MKKKAIERVYVVFLIGCLVLVGSLTPSWGANKAEMDLINAAVKDDLAQVKSLIAAGVDVNTKDKDGNTALMVASTLGDVEMVQVLLAAKADVNAKANHGDTALMFASQEGHVDVVRVLLAAKADVNAKDDAGRTALWYASDEGHDDVVKLLKQAGGKGIPEPMGKEEDCTPFNPVSMIVRQIQGHWKIIDGSSVWLLDFGVKKADADRALAIIQHYGMNLQCFVGRNNPLFLQYYLVSGASPVGPFAGEDCVSFNPGNTTVQQIQGHWKVVDGKHSMFDFGTNKAGADETLVIIKRYGFTYSCFVGRPGAKFSYLRK